MAHHRVAQVQGARVGGLDPGHAAEDRPPLLGTAQVAGQHCIAIAQLTDRRNPLYKCRYLRWSKHFSGPLAILSMVGELHGIERPDLHPDPLHGKHRSAVAGVTEYHVGLDGEQMRCTFHAGLPKRRNEKQGAQYGAKCHLYDRPGRQLSWAYLVGAYVNVDPGKSLRADAAGHGRRLVVA
ncbi:hypothetical protein D3C85_1341020 [compost metagenome]